MSQKYFIQIFSIPPIPKKLTKNFINKIKLILLEANTRTVSRKEVTCFLQYNTEILQERERRIREEHGYNLILEYES